MPKINMKVTELIKNDEYVRLTAESCEQLENLEELNNNPNYERFIISAENNDEDPDPLKRPRGLYYATSDILVFKEEIIFSPDITQKGECEVIQVNYSFIYLNYLFNLISLFF